MRVIREYPIEKWGGLLTETKDLRKVPDGWSPDELNWITQTDQRGIELRRGTALLGQTRQEGPGAITGLGVGKRFDGVEIPFFTHGRKVKYYDADSDDTVEVGTDLLPEAADGEGVSINPYQNLGGSFTYLSSPNSSIYKIPVANPGNAVNQNSNDYRGHFKFGQSRGFLFNRNGSTPGNSDKMGLYASHVDKVDLSLYPAQVTAEAVGALGGQNYTHTLAQITGVRTAMYAIIAATVAAGTETFVDDRNGNLVSNFGGTGTINYATGAVDVTFSAITTGAVTASYYYEDATDGGVVDFTITDPSDRVPGEGNYFAQFDGGGALNSLFPLATVFYSFHTNKTWQTEIPTDDDGATNLPFRDTLGVKSAYGAYGGDAGIYLVNTANPSKPEFHRLSLYQGATAANIAVTKLLSELIDFSPFGFDLAYVYEWNEYVLVCCQQTRNGVLDDYNSRMFLYNKKNGLFNLLDNPSSRLVEYMGTLLAGDPITNNVFTLFSGWDDDENLIPNYYTEGEKDFGIDGQKRFTRMYMEGLIQSSQSYAIDLSFDGGTFTEVFTVEGTGSYVDTGASVAVGSYTVGSKVAGGGQTVYANPYAVEFIVQSPRFVHVRPRIRALSGGYVSINKMVFKDIREKSGRYLPENMGS